MTQPRREAVYSTPLGHCYHGDSLAVLRQLPDDSVNLVLTSPPYALRRVGAATAVWRAARRHRD